MQIVKHPVKLIVQLALAFVILYPLLVMFLPDEATVSFVEILAPKNNREGGLIESLQHLILAIIIANLVIRITQSTSQKNKYICVAFLLFVGFVFLEETDYLMHYIELITGKNPFTINLGGFRNLHNSEVTFSMHRVAYWICAVVTITITFLWLKSERNKTTKTWLMLLLFSLIAIQFGLSIGGILYLNEKLEGPRQIISETIELNLYISWLWLLQKTPTRFPISLQQ